MEIIIGTLLLIGLFTRIISGIAAFYMSGVMAAVGYNDIAVRDVGIMLATVSLFLSGGEKWCLDLQLREKISKLPILRWLYLFDTHVPRTESKG